MRLPVGNRAHGSYAHTAARSSTSDVRRDILSSAVRVGLLFPIYVVLGLLVAGGIIGNEESYFSGLDNLEEVIELVLVVLLWPLVLLDVNINIGDVNIGGGDSGGGSGGGSTGAAGGGGGGK